MNLPPVSTSIDRLSNGLRVVTVELPHLHGAAACAFVRVGSRFEEAVDNGLSHFLEHMMFRGTRRLPDAFHINRAVEELGGTLYAETRRDASLYQIGLPGESLPQGVGLLGEILADPAFSQIDVERRIILEEMQEDLDERGEDVNLGDLVCGASWPSHPLGQKITGTEGNVRRFHDGDLRRHYESFYAASNIVLCVSGAVRRADVLSWAEGSPFGALPAGSQPEVRAPMPPQAGAGPHRIHRDGDAGTQTSISLAFRAYGELDPDFPALGLLSRVLDDGMSTRLYQRVVNELGLAYYVGAGLDLMVDTGLFELEATATHVNVPALCREMLALCSGLCDEPIPSDELARVKRRYRWDLEGLVDDPSAMAEAFGRAELYYPPRTLDERLARVQAVTSEDVQRAARRIFRPDHLSVVSVGRMGARHKGQVLAAVDAFRDSQRADSSD